MIHTRSASCKESIEAFPNNTLGQDDQYLEHALLTTQVVKYERLYGGTNIVALVDLDDGNSGIFKPGSGERRLEIEASHYKLFQRERAAFLVDRAIDFNFVPHTVIRCVGGEQGSLQFFIPNSEYFGKFKNYPKIITDQLYGISLFDYLIWSKDRKHNHFLLKEGRVYAIDNGLSFDRWREYYITENLNSYVCDVQPPQKIIQAVTRFIQSPQKQMQLRQDLQGLIPLSEIEAHFSRIEIVGKALLTNRVIQYKDLSVAEASYFSDYKLRYS